MAAAGHAEIFAHRLAGDLAAGVEDALHHGGVDLGHVAFHELRTDHHRHPGEADIVLERDAAASELAPRLALIEVRTYQAPCGFSSADGQRISPRAYFTVGSSSGVASSVA